MTYSPEDFLKEQDVKFYKSYSIKKLSSVGIGGNADIVAIPNSKEKLIKLLEYAEENRIRYKVVGRMTNVLASDNDYHGILIITKEINFYYEAENCIIADCGVILSNLIYKLAGRSKGGMYNLYGIPGSVGGAVCGNAGAYGSSISDFIIEADAYSPKEKKPYKLSAAEMNFVYRKSIFKTCDLILLSAKIKTDTVSSEEEFLRMNRVISKRRSSQPYSDKSLGSVFKRSGEIPISKLIDNLKLKGFSVGDAEISNKHAGFIINKGQASSEDFLRLTEVIKNKVESRYGIVPELEIEVLNGD